MKGRPQARQGPEFLAWRSRRKPGSIMHPSTFEEIVRKAAARGASNPKAVAGAAYWSTAHKKFRSRHGGH